MVCSHYFKNILVNSTTNFQSLIYFCLLLSGCVNQHRKYPCGNPLFQVQTLMHYLHRTMSTRGQSDKAISAWLECIRTKRIQSPGLPPFLTLHHPPTLESSTGLTKNYFPSKNCTQFNSLPSNLLHNIVMGNAGILHHNKKIIITTHTKQSISLCVQVL